MKKSTVMVFAIMIATSTIGTVSQAQAKKRVITSEIVCDGGDAVLVETVERRFLGIRFGTTTTETVLGPSEGC